ncbi:hypothetical protein Tco_0108829 [Tanacetum coccineum]
MCVIQYRAQLAVETALIANPNTCDNAGKARRETVHGKDYILLPLCPADLLLSQNSKSSPDAGFKPSGDNEKKVTEEPGKEGGDPSNKNDSVNSTNNINTASDGNITNNVNTVSSMLNTAGIELNVNKQFAHAISVIDFSKDEPFSGSTTTHSDALPPSSSPMKTSDNLEEFADELTLLKKDVHF